MKELRLVGVVPNLELERYESCGLPECIEEEYNGLSGQRTIDSEMTDSVGSGVPGCEGPQTARSPAIVRLFIEREPKDDIRILQPLSDVMPCAAHEHRRYQMATVLQAAKDIEEDVIRKRRES